MKYLLKLILISLSFEVFSNDLLSIYKEALDKDPEFNSKKADLAISKESLNQSRSGLLPQVRVTGGTNWNEYYQDRELQNDYNTFSYGLNISQPLFRLDKWFLNKQAKENLEAAEAQFAYQQQELIIKVTRAYFKVLSARANLEAKVATEKALRNQYDSVLERFNTGSVSRIELAEAKALAEATAASAGVGNEQSLFVGARGAYTCFHVASGADQHNYGSRIDLALMAPPPVIPSAAHGRHAVFAARLLATV